MVSRLKNIRAHQLSSVIGYKGLTIKNITNLARAGRVTCREKAWFWYNRAWNFTCCTTVPQVSIEPSGNFKLIPSNRYIRTWSSEILAVQDRFSNRFQQRRTPHDACHSPACHSNPTDMINIHRPTIKTPTPSPRRGRWKLANVHGGKEW